MSASAINRDAQIMFTFTSRHAAEMVDDLAHLVEIESGSEDRVGIEQVAALYSDWLAPLGFRTETVAEGAHRHVVARRGGTADGQLLVLVHLDTVWPAGTLSTFPFRSSGDRASGPGVADMKGGLIILLWALRALQDAGRSSASEFVIFMTADEELGSRTARPHIERIAAGSDHVLVMEPARESGAIVTSRGAVGALELEVRGLTGHSVTGRVGASAIQALARKVLALEGLSDRAAGLVVNVGLVRGGSARQVVPEHAWASIDLRAPTTERAETLLDAIRRVVACEDVPGTVAQLGGGLTRPAFRPTAGGDRLFALLRECAAALGINLRSEATGAGSDGNFTAALGVPTLDGLGAHGFNVCSKDEYILLSSLPERSALLAALIAHLPTRAARV